MSEYFCPNCGADLEDQYGFDPDKGVWTCTNCGETLYGDDVAETMEQFDGVVWYCDSCGAVLNKQSGFYDSCGTWYCTECGHANHISEDEIYESEEDYQNSQKEYECPHCGSKLNDQYSFDSDSDTHICTWCDTHLYKDDDEYKVQYRCPFCDAILNEQWGFDENLYYTCDECGKELYLSDNEYIIESDDSDSDDDDNIGNDGSSDYSNSSSQESEHSSSYYEEQHRQDELRRYAQEQKRQETERIKREKKKAFRKKHWKGILITVLLIVAALFGGYKYWEYSKLIPVGVAVESLIGKDYKSATEILKRSGFTNIHTSPLYDLEYENRNDDGLTVQISIADNDSFNAEDKYAYDSRIVIEYHSIARRSVPISAKQAKGEQYQDIFEQLENAGFGNIIVSVDYDLITGWINGAGEVESISINGDAAFEQDSQYAVDAKIEIVYHDFKKNNPNK